MPGVRPVTKRKPRKTRCVLCGRRLYLAPAGEGSKTARPICPLGTGCRPCDGVLL